MKDKKILLNNKYILKFLIFLEVEPFLKIKKIKKKTETLVIMKTEEYFNWTKQKNAFCLDV